MSWKPGHSFDSETAPQAGKTPLRLIVVGTWRAAIKDGAPCRWPYAAFCLIFVGLLRIVSESNERPGSGLPEMIRPRSPSEQCRNGLLVGALRARSAKIIGVLAGEAGLLGACAGFSDTL